MRSKRASPDQILSELNGWLQLRGFKGASGDCFVRESHQQIETRGLSGFGVSGRNLYRIGGA